VLNTVHANVIFRTGPRAVA